ncbi:MAG: hypothetical protein IT435_10310 [Phycisphaerales bacterium]|nr:hypothetical protein [Phycisphaerales bacterium]
MEEPSTPARVYAAPANQVNSSRRYTHARHRRDATGKTQRRDRRWKMQDTPTITSIPADGAGMGTWIGVLGSVPYAHASGH